MPSILDAFVVCCIGSIYFHRFCASLWSSFSDVGMSGNDEPIIMKLRDLNCVLTCRLCNGYLIDATTITECLHTFCRSCILNYLDQDHRGSGGNNGDKMGNIKCPTCDTLIHESQPKQHIVSDSTMDEIVMKLVPELRES